MRARHFVVMGCLLAGSALVSCGDDDAGEGGSGDTGTGSGTGTDTGDTGTGTGTGTGVNAGTCADPIPAADPSQSTNDTSNGSDNMVLNCTGDTDGPELVYQVTPAADGDLLISLLFPGPASPDLDMFAVTDCLDPTNTELACAGTSSSEQMTVTATTGVPFYVIIDGFGGDMGAFELVVGPVPNESTCQNFFDDDFDSMIDCDDPTDCQAGAMCVPGAGVYGSACTVNTECAATANDPACLTEASLLYPNGYCSEWCDLATPDCVGDGVCVDFGVNNGLCLDGCAVDGDCVVGYACVDIGAADTVCWPDSCQASVALNIGVNMGDNSDGFSTHQSTCISGGASTEIVYEYTAGADGTLDLILDSQADLGMHVRSPSCGDVADEAGCVDDGVGGDLEVLSVPITMGETYYIIVDGYNGNVGPFTLDASII